MDPAGRQGGSAGTGLALEAFREDAQRLDAGAFAAKHGNAFLLVTASTGLDGSSTSTRLFLEGVDDDPSAHTAELAVLVYALRPKSGPVAADMVTIGRESRHDVVVVDPSVSRFHCIAKCDPDGSWSLQDMGSSNGTVVNRSSVLARGAGEPTPVKPGDTVRLGQVQFTFIDAVALRDFTRQMGG